MISLCFSFPVKTEIIGLRQSRGCRGDKMSYWDGHPNCLDFPSSHCSSIPSMGKNVENK